MEFRLNSIEMVHPILHLFTGQFHVTVNNEVKHITTFNQPITCSLCVLYSKPDVPAFKHGGVGMAARRYRQTVNPHTVSIWSLKSPFHKLLDSSGSRIKESWGQVPTCHPPDVWPQATGFSSRGLFLPLYSGHTDTL